VALPGTTARPCLQVRQAVAAMIVQRPQPACAHHTRCMPACQGMCRAPACTVCHAQVSFRSGASALYGLLSLQHRDNVDQAISKRRDVSSADVQRALCSSSARRCNKCATGDPCPAAPAFFASLFWDCTAVVCSGTSIPCHLRWLLWLCIWLAIPAGFPLTSLGWVIWSRMHILGCVQGVTTFTMPGQGDLDLVRS
jgi:hypothetical protein